MEDPKTTKLYGVLIPGVEDGLGEKWMIIKSVHNSQAWEGCADGCTVVDVVCGMPVMQKQNKEIQKGPRGKIRE